MASRNLTGLLRRSTQTTVLLYKVILISLTLLTDLNEIKVKDYIDDIQFLNYLLIFHINYLWITE